MRPGPCCRSAIRNRRWRGRGGHGIAIRADQRRRERHGRQGGVWRHRHRRQARVDATDNLKTDSYAISVQGGAGALSAAVAIATLSGSTQASAAPTGSIGSGGISVTANGTHYTNALSPNIAVGALAIGGTVAVSTNGRSTLATLGSDTNVSSGGSVLVKATGDNYAIARTPGGGGGGISITIMVPVATVSGATRAKLDGTLTTSTGVMVQAFGQNKADASALVANLAVFGITGAFAFDDLRYGRHRGPRRLIGLDRVERAVLIEAKVQERRTREQPDSGCLLGGPRTLRTRTGTRRGLWRDRRRHRSARDHGHDRQGPGRREGNARRQRHELVEHHGQRGRREQGRRGYEVSDRRPLRKRVARAPSQSRAATSRLSSAADRSTRPVP